MVVFRKPAQSSEYSLIHEVLIKMIILYDLMYNNFQFLGKNNVLKMSIFLEDIFQ